MTKTLAALLIVLMAAGARVNAQQQDGPEPDVIYGGDGRQDLYQVKNKKVLKLADSTVALFQGADVAVNGAQAALTTSHYGKLYNLCEKEKFRDQVSGAFCSGSLVAPDVVMTAGHCVKSQEDCLNTKFVFGFAIKKAGRMPESVPASEVYGCAQLLGREQINSGADWALVKLDRAVPNHAPLALDLSGKLAKGNLLFVIGHPAGLPTKVAGGAKVRDASPEGFYVATLDTYGGNSGSAVFNAKTGLVNGILVRGEVDYVWKGACRVSNTCAENACRGEDVTKVTAAKFPRTEARPNARLVSFGERLSSLLERNASALQ